MPVVLRNNTNSIEIDIHANLKYTVSKGSFDVILEDTGVTATAIVYVILRIASIIDNIIKLDWRYCSIIAITYRSSHSSQTTCGRP
jgi:hypothetical protein